ncbi:MAG: prepilin-type N-terminal cleavage/methylation domain-containing protein [Pseudomonadota bacterium]
MDKRRTIVTGAFSSIRRRQSGLTLIELLVVMTILALAATIVIMNAPPARDPMRAVATSFANDVRAAIDDAVISGAGVRFEFEPSAYYIARFQDGEWKRVAQTTNNAAQKAISEGDLLIRIEIDDPAKSNAAGLSGGTAPRQKKSEPTIVPIDPYGDMPSFTATFQRGRSVWSVRRAGNARIEVRRQ